MWAFIVAIFAYFFAPRNPPFLIVVERAGVGVELGERPILFKNGAHLASVAARSAIDALSSSAQIASLLPLSLPAVLLPRDDMVHRYRDQHRPLNASARVRAIDNLPLTRNATLSVAAFAARPNLYFAGLSTMFNGSPLGDLLGDVYERLYYNASDEKRESHVFVAAHGVRVQTHYDDSHNIFLQLSGRKTFDLYRHDCAAIVRTPWLHPGAGRHVVRDAPSPDATATLAAGDLLYIPPLVYHGVRVDSADALSVSVNGWTRSFRMRPLRAALRGKLPFEPRQWPRAQLLQAASLFAAHFLDTRALSEVCRRYELYLLRDRGAASEETFAFDQEKFARYAVDIAAALATARPDHLLTLYAAYIEELYLFAVSFGVDESVKLNDEEHFMPLFKELTRVCLA